MLFFLIWRYFSSSYLISSLSQWSGMYFNFYIFVNFPVFLYWYLLSFYCGQIYVVWFQYSNLRLVTEHDLCGRKSYVLDKKVYSVSEMFYSLKSIWSIVVSLCPYWSVSIVCWKWGRKSLTTTVLLSLSSFGSVSVCFVYLDAVMASAYVFINLLCLPDWAF